MGMMDFVWAVALFTVILAVAVWAINEPEEAMTAFRGITRTWIKLVSNGVKFVATVIVNSADAMIEGNTTRGG